MAAIAAAAGAPGPASASAGDYWRDCGTRVVGEALLVTTKSHAVNCKIARKVAKEYARKDDLSPLGFTCTTPKPDPSGESQKGVCKREGARVKVIFGI
jgi:hypothetical protein